MKILIAYHSVHGHTLQLAKAVAEGISSVDGAEAVLRRADEFPENVKDNENGSGNASKV